MNEIRDKGFFKKNFEVRLEKEAWGKIVDAYPLAQVCCLYVTRWFACLHGAAGKLGGRHKKKHKNWADLSTDEKG